MRVIASADLVGCIDDGIGRVVAALADGVAPVVQVRRVETGARVRLDGHLQPLLFNRVVGEHDRDTVRAVHALAGTHRDGRRFRNRRPNRPACRRCRRRIRSRRAPAF